MRQASCVAVIPARGGSRGIPRKNLIAVGGRPLIAWTIQTALGCSVLDRVIVSTDDENIADVASRYGAEVPFLRPTELARDETPGIEPILHAVRWLEVYDEYRPDYTIVLQPTSPLRSSQDIETVVQLALEEKADAVVSVCEVDQHPYWMKQITEDGRLADFLSLDRVYTRRQDLPLVYALNGAVYLARREVLLERETFYTESTYAFVMPRERSLDVDTPWHLYLADLILTDRIKNGNH